jgi:hypothetical protein
VLPGLTYGEFLRRSREMLERRRACIERDDAAALLALGGSIPATHARHLCVAATDRASAGCLRVLLQRSAAADLDLSDCAAYAASRSLECLRLLVEERGAPADARAPMMAARDGRLDCLEYLLDERVVDARALPCVWWREASCGAAAGGHLECLRHLRERLRAFSRDAWSTVTFAASCCLWASTCCLDSDDSRWFRQMRCLRYVVASSGVSPRDLAAFACRKRGFRPPVHFVCAFRAWWTCRRMHACATALKRAWSARRTAARTAAAAVIADAWLQHHYAPRGRGCTAARTRFELQQK